VGSLTPPSLRPSGLALVVTWLAGAATLVALGCGHTPCETDADCSSDAVCNAKACTKRSAPKPPNPAECGARCAIGDTRCDWEPLTSSYQRCDVGADGCSTWAVAQACADTGFCVEGTGCVAYAAEGGPCADAARCSPSLTCASLDALGGAAALTCRRSCFDEGDCGAAEACVFDACVPAELCAGCSAGEARCASGQPELCERVDGVCTRWRSEDACRGADVCLDGACVGTIAAGESCAAENCQPGLVCLEDSMTCTLGCSASAQCRTGACRFTRGSQGRGICTATSSPTVEDQCSLFIGRLFVPGLWDEGIGLGSTFTPDLYVVVSGGELDYVTGAGQDSNEAVYDVTTPLVPFASFFFATVRVWDDDSPFSLSGRSAAGGLGRRGHSWSTRRR
jgi:hypothetical protein